MRKLAFLIEGEFLIIICGCKSGALRLALKPLGGRLRLMIGTDNAPPYDTNLFFYTCGIELLELSPELFIVRVKHC